MENAVQILDLSKTIWAQTATSEIPQHILLTSTSMHSCMYTTNGKSHCAPHLDMMKTSNMALIMYLFGFWALAVHIFVDVLARKIACTSKGQF